MYRISIEPTALPDHLDIRWDLQAPTQGEEISLTTLQSTGVEFAGRVTVSDGRAVEAFVRYGERTQYFPAEFQPAQRSTLKTLLGYPAQSSHHTFRFSLLLPDPKAEFGVRVGEDEHILAVVSVKGALAVLEGKHGWLFLDNDTNHSVDQFKGHYLLGDQELSAWYQYLNELENAAERIGARHAVLIAPAKEMVLSEFYPHSKGEVTPAEQVLCLKEQHNIVYPVESLRRSEYPAFRVCDTHWTPHGAMLATFEVLVKLGLKTQRLRTRFAKDSYQERIVGGDLGSKLYPPRFAAERLLTRVTYRKRVIYDNYLPNFGRIIVTRNATARYKAKCLVFGSSSSYMMLNYYYRAFTDVVFVHTAGNVDLDMLECEKPQYLIVQTNGRFVVRPPVVSFDLAAVIAEKLAAMNAQERAGVMGRAEQWVLDENNSSVRHYHALFK